ncbi:hypothetical protein LC087_12345 [Bacillus carboniphilus]|uniref:DUF4352 domain-containing protein n=1 Tax=Bacillus carboniphilus TaxID=86663 RepID=A0ABY9JVE9_9BACI|nr:hypothetical protein [Bacillus carboniphilus]WLR41656.1 hypothetical protein LC087_12345 [Bacillus carboniphilus]
MKKFLSLLFIAVLSLSTVACSESAATDELEKNDKEKSEAKTGDDATPVSDDDKEKAKEDDIWTYYEDATWSDDFKGLKMEIQKIFVTNEAPSDDDPDALTSAVGMKFKLENTTDGKFTTFPDQAVLVTSTGEQIEMTAFWGTDDVGGEIDKGVIKEGNVIWNLQRGEADKIEWVKINFDAQTGDYDTPYDEIEQNDYEIELQLK